MSFLVIKTREKTRPKEGPNFLYKVRKNKTNEVISVFSDRVIENEDLINAESGLYTWILRESNNIYAIKTITKQEIGTLHINLDLYTREKDNTPIIAAGELIINDDKSIYFNLLSGSYMAKKFKNSEYDEAVELRNELVRKVASKLENKSVFLDCNNPDFDFLTSDNMGCSDEEKIAGIKLIEGSDIINPKENLNFLNKYFNRVYNNTERKHKKGKASKSGVKGGKTERKLRKTRKMRAR